MISSLYPPNSDALRDIVIGGVVDRIVPRCSDRPEHHISGRLESFGPPSADNTSPTGQQYLPHQLVPSKAKKEPKRRILYSRREQCHINQARYRSRQHEYDETMKFKIGQLKKDVWDLEVEQKTILSRTPITRNLWAVATRLFYLFENGYTTNDHPSSQTRAVAAQQPRIQLAFLRTTLASDVTDGIVHGVEAIIENWKLLSLYHDVRTQRMELVTEDSLLANVMVRLTITTKTLQHVYPHMIDIEKGELAPPTAKLLNQRLLIHGSVRFDWDESSERVVRLESKFDMISPMLKLLGSLDDVARVFGKALVTPEGRFLSIDKTK